MQLIERIAQATAADSDLDALISQDLGYEKTFPFTQDENLSWAYFRAEHPLWHVKVTGKQAVATPDPVIFPTGGTVFSGNTRALSLAGLALQVKTNNDLLMAMGFGERLHLKKLYDQFVAETDYDSKVAKLEEIFDYTVQHTADDIAECISLKDEIFTKQHSDPWNDTSVPKSFLAVLVLRTILSVHRFRVDAKSPGFQRFSSVFQPLIL